MENKYDSPMYEAVQSAKLLLRTVKLEAKWAGGNSYDHKYLMTYLKATSFETRVVASMGNWILEKGYYTFVNIPKTADVLKKLEEPEVAEKRNTDWVKAQIYEDRMSGLPGGGYYHEVITRTITTASTLPAEEA